MMTIFDDGEQNHNPDTQIDFFFFFCSSPARNDDEENDFDLPGTI